ncbi:hypothetical protein U8V72_21185 [Priestia filamentosa]|uniref:hypothetical protein n=1 Tax=Priestia filamentosa TaxID=1402861 RepID=UPI00397D969F
MTKPKTKPKRRGRKKQAPIISNTGFLGAAFADTLELSKYEYYFSRKNMRIVHRVLDGLLQAASTVFENNQLSAYMSCAYLPKQKKIGIVLSRTRFSHREGEAYFNNYLKEHNHYIGRNKDKYDEIFNTGFLGVVFADLSAVEKYTFEDEVQMIKHLFKQMIIPVKELFIQNRIKVYMSGVELEDQDKIGYVLSSKPYEEKEADLYFVEYLKEWDLYESDEEEDYIPIITGK